MARGLTVDVAHLFDSLLLGPNIEVVESRLPEVIKFLRTNSTGVTPGGWVLTAEARSRFLAGLTPDSE